MMRKGSTRTRFLTYVAFLAGLLIALGGCSPAPEVSIVIPPEPAVELEPGDSIPLEARVTRGEAVQFEWTAECLQADNDECQQVLKSKEGETNFITAPDRPGEQIIVSVVAVDSQGRESEKDTKTVEVVTPTTEPTKKPTNEPTPPVIERPTSLVIEAPTEGDEVDRPIIVSGSGAEAALEAGTNLYVLVYPHGDLYYVQQLPRIENDGSWKAQPVYIGRPGQEDKGRSFDICAILTSEQLSLGQMLSTLPPGSTDCITVERQ